MCKIFCIFAPCFVRGTRHFICSIASRTCTSEKTKSIKYKPSWSMHFKCRLPIGGLGQCKAREAYGESLRFLCGVNSQG